MTIVNSEITSDRMQANNTRKISEQFTDHLGKKYDSQYSGVDVNYDTDARLSAGAITVDESTATNEINEGIAIFKSGGDPLYVDEGGWFSKVTPNYQTWEALASGTTIPFLSEEDQLELVYLQDMIIRMTTNDKKLIWGMTNQQVSSVNSDIQTAVNTQASLDLYLPWFDDNGVLKA